jgi:hypothetical protein
MRFRFPLLMLAALAACSDDPTGPKVAPTPEPPRALGLVEITFTRLGTGEMSATVTPAGLAGGASRSVSAVPGAVPGGTIQLGLRTTSTVDAGGQRYLQAVFRVRNATADGTPNGRDLRNVTFIPVSTSQTIPGTPVLRFLKQDGSPADPALAAQLKPTGAVADNGSGGLASQYPDVLQAYTENEVAAIDMSGAPAVTNRFPYGFVTRRVDNATTRDLPASPAPDQYDGAVTFAYRFPTQSSAANNPFTISILALAVEDDVTRITQSIEEQGAGQAAFEARAQSLGVSHARLLPGGAFDPPIPDMLICIVRTAGDPGSPTAYLGSAGARVLGLYPNPYSAQGSRIARDEEIYASFDGNVTGLAPGNFLVHGFQSAGTFLNGSYGGNQPHEVTFRHTGTFFPGEEVEVSLAGGIACTPHVARLRVATAPATGLFNGEQFITGGQPRAVALRDVNGDGRLDVVTANDNTNNLSVLLGNGAGRFAGPANYPLTVAGQPGDLDLGDLDGDGRLDAVAPKVGANAIAVLLGTAGGGFAAPSRLDVRGGPRSAALGDVNGDGRLDIVSASFDTNELAVLLGNGGGGFGAPTYYAVGTQPTDVVLGDLNGDGRLDVVTAEGTGFFDGTLSVRLGTAGGGFGAAAQFVTRTPRALALGDVNGDARLDVVTAGGRVHLGDGGGGLGAPREYSTGGNDVELADLNADGHLDIMTPAARPYLGDGAGNFTAGALYVPGGNAVAVGDVNGDGRPDAVTANAPSTSVGVLMGNGAGGFAANPEYRMDGDFVALGDLNGDGRLDMLTTVSVTAEVSVRLGTAGGFAEPVNHRVGNGPRFIALGDVNDDGRLDVTTANSISDDVSVLLGDGSGGFAAQTRFAAGHTPYSVALGDLNGDGRLDVATGNFSQQHLSVLLGTGGGALGAPTHYPQLHTGRGVAMADVDRDGRLDVVTTAYGIDHVSVWLGDGTGRLAGPTRFAVGNEPHRVVLGDVTADGITDAVVGHLGSNVVSVLPGDGNGNLGAMTSYPVRSPQESVALGDVDGDGRLDIVSAHLDLDRVSVLRNHGSGFSAATFFSANAPKSLALGDVTGDGRLDVVAAGITVLAGQAP